MKPSAIDPAGRSFLFTGKLATMTRAAAQQRVKAIGGKPASTVSKTLDVLVIGDEASALYGGAKSDKHRKAEVLNAAGFNIHIISEKRFLALQPKDDTASTVTAAELPTVSEARAPDVGSWQGAVCGGCVGDGTLYLAGGIGGDHLRKTRDGKKFTPVKTTGPGLRGCHVDSDAVWMVGEYGHLARTTTAFKNAHVVDLDTSACMFDVTRGSDGQLWACGDDGVLVRSPDDESFLPVKGIKAKVSALVDTRYGLVVASYSGLFVIANNKPKKLGLAAKVADVVVTRAGTIVACGPNNTMYRSTDRGKTFKKVKVPALTPAKTKRKLQKLGWWKSVKDMNVIVELDDGRLVAAGDCGVIIASCDDGLSWRRVEQSFTDGSFWGAVAFNGAAYVGGENGIVLRVS